MDQQDDKQNLSGMPPQLDQLEQLLSSEPVMHSKGSLGAMDDYLEQLAPILKDALLTDTTSELLTKCDVFKKERDAEIDEICSGDHNEYMASVRQLGEVTHDAEAIKSKVVNVHDRLNSTGLSLVHDKKRLLESRRVRANVDAAIDAVTACLRVLDLTNNVHELLQDKRKFAALKSLDDLQNVHLKEVSQFGFAQLINQSVPALTKMVRSETLSDMQKWLDGLQRMNGEVGRQAFQAIQRQRQEWKAITDAYPHLKKYMFNSPVEKSYRETGLDYLSDIKVKIDFSHLYECVLVHQNMGMSDDFLHHLDSDRKIQRDYLISKNVTFQTSDGDDDLSAFEATLEDTAGFCIIDRLISRHNEQLRPSKEVEDLWESLAQKLNSILAIQSKSLKKVESLKKLKELMRTFLHTMQNAGFNISSINGILITLFTTYTDFMKSIFRNSFQHNIEQDDFMPLQVNGKELYDKILKSCWYTPPQSDASQNYPKVFPFSKIYPLTCVELKTFIDAQNSFLDDLQYDLGQVEDLIHSSVDDLLCNTICKTMDSRLRSSTREQVVQTLVNLDHFQEATRGLDQMLYDQRLSGKKRRTDFKAVESFASARKLAERSVFEIIHKNIDGFLDLADYDWRTKTRTVEPSSYLQDMVSYLQTLVSSTFINLPPSIKSLLYFDAFDYLSTQMIQLLLQGGTYLTYEAVENFDIDVQYLEGFVDKTGQDSKEASLTTILAELRQCVDLIQADNIREYNEPTIRFKKYDRVQPETAQTLFRLISHEHSLRHGSEEDTSNSATSSPRTSGNANSPHSNTFLKYVRTSRDKLSDRLDKFQQSSLN